MRKRQGFTAEFGACNPLLRHMRANVVVFCNYCQLIFGIKTRFIGSNLLFRGENP